jgi:two-component system sensor histidine kinase MtrB
MGMTGQLRRSQAPHLLAAVPRRIAAVWSGSLVLRTVATTLVLSLAVVALVATALVNRVTTGLLAAKQERSLEEAADDWRDARQLLAAADAGPATATPARIVDGLITVLARNAGSPPRYEVLLLNAPGDGRGPERATNLISPSSVPPRLQQAVAAGGTQQWTNTTAVFLDGRTGAAMVTGAPVTVPGAGPYQLFHVFPYNEEIRVTGLVRSAGIVAGALLVGLLGMVSWAVAQQVAVPVRQAARVAGRVAAGDLDQRLLVRRSDEIAQLAESFNAMADELQRQIEELEELSAVQQRFVSDVSHELRTPLTTIRMASDVLHDRRSLVDTDTSRAIELLADQVDRFESLLSDLLEISRIDAGAAELDLEDFDLRGCVQAVLDDAAPLAAERSVALTLLPGAPAPVLADRRRVSRIVRNLVTNALEYGGGRPVQIVVAGDGDAAGVGVRDHGPGLESAAASRVFDRFWRADSSRARTLGGTGLGLSIAGEDAALQGGVLELASRPGVGSVFVLTLPRAARTRRPGHRPVPVDVAAFDDLARSSQGSQS